jgi:hypothetical protein
MECGLDAGLERERLKNRDAKDGFCYGGYACAGSREGMLFYVANQRELGSALHDDVLGRRIL